MPITFGAQRQRTIKPGKSVLKPKIFKSLTQTTKRRVIFAMTSYVCRVCLVGHNRMHNIDKIHLLEIYEKLTNIKLNVEVADGMPNSLCYACHKQLQRCHNFSEMALKSNRILQEIWPNGTEVTPNKVSMLTLEMIQNLSVSPTYNISVESDISTTVTEEKVVVKEEIVVIKEEKNIVKEEQDIVKKEKVFVKVETTENEEIKIEEIKFDKQDKHPIEIELIQKENNKKRKPEVTKKSYIKHRTSEKPYSCNRCGRAFNVKSNLTRHMLVHTGEKPYICNVCNKAFSENGNLTKHMLVHTAERAYLCKECSKAFRRKADLKIHMLVHIGEKPYSCNRCHKAFNLKSQVTKHMLVHTGEKPYSCNVCK